MPVFVFAQKKDITQQFLSGVTAAGLKAKLSIIAGPDMEGRETATAGQKKAALYIENYFRQLGLQAGAADGYQLFFPAYQDSITNSFLIVNGKKLIVNNDYTVNASYLINDEWSSDSIVFASFGIMDSSSSDFKNLTVKNKWVLIAEGSVADTNKTSGFVSYSSKNPASDLMKISWAKNHGAAGVLIAAKDFPKNKPAAQKGNIYQKKINIKNIPVFYISLQTASGILNKPLQSFSELKKIDKGMYAVQLSADIAVTTLNLQSSNVIGLLPGTDKKDEYVLITAHYDHLGKKDSVIWFGADDDGSGTASVLEIAEAFANAREKGHVPRRTIVFMTVSGEEEGLWGSEYYTLHPLFPLDKTSVDLNIDMVGRIDPKRENKDSMNYVYLIGEDKLSTDLMKISDSINSKYTHLDLDRKYNDPKDPERFYYRSDHYNFAKKGVPVIFYFNGTHADYHKPTDTVDKINFDVMEKRVRLIFCTAWAIANREEMLKRDIPLK